MNILLFYFHLIGTRYLIYLSTLVKIIKLKHSNKNNSIKIIQFKLNIRLYYSEENCATANSKTKLNETCLFWINSLEIDGNPS